MQTAVIPSVPSAAPAPGAFTPLDEPAEWQGFSRPVDGRDGAWESWLAITGMHCAACALSVEQALARLPGVASVEVNGPAALARIVWSPGPTRPSAWLTALERAGYPVAATKAYEAALAVDSGYTKASVSLARVTAAGQPAESDSVDLAEFSTRFQTEIDAWKTSDAADSTTTSGSPAPSDSSMGSIRGLSDSSVASVEAVSDTLEDCAAEAD